jgi:hypothetical protein
LREVRFSRQLGNQAEKSPQLDNLSFWRDDGNNIPLCQSRLEQFIISKSFRRGKLPNLLVGRDNKPQNIIQILSMAGRYRRSSMALSSLQSSMVR